MLQISSGQGPDECELAVGKLFAALCREFTDIEIIDKSPGKQAGCFKSIRFYGGDELRALEGSVQWMCVSSFRPKHKRKNWFVDISVCAEADFLLLREELVRYDTFRSNGKGGQHVNKTESGVRAVYGPTGDSVIVTDERSQHRNKQIALERLRKLLAEKNQADQDIARNRNWLENYRIVRGNPIRIYEGMEFRLRRKQ
ncbi:peptide chain release factor H [Clostridia bacterium]|nr:peptide chain release factor H [Clostridia bacterium]